MKQFLTLLILVLAVSCSPKDDLSGSGENDPLSECVIIESAKPGDDAFIQWNGFKENAQIFLVDDKGNEYAMQISVITASGIIFKIPSSLLPGIYTVVLHQDSVYELGMINILEDDMPIGNLSFPLYALPGEKLFITGTGFNASHSIYLKSDSQNFQLEGDFSQNGVSIQIPESAQPGKYSLWLVDGNKNWLLTDSFTVIANKKRLLSVTRSEPYIAEYRYYTSYSLEYDGDVVRTIQYSASIRENGDVVSEEELTRYVLGDDGVYRAEDGETSSNNYNFSYTKDIDGKIIYSDVLRYSRSNPDGTMRQFTWIYDAQGRPTDVTFVLQGETMSIQRYVYEDDNLVETSTSSFVYDNPELINHPFGVDAAHLFDMMNNTMEPFLYAPLLTGEHPFTSKLLPSAFRRVTGATTSEIVPLNYEYDEEGYVKYMIWDDDNSMLVFEYDN